MIKKSQWSETKEWITLYDLIENRHQQLHHIGNENYLPKQRMRGERLDSLNVGGNTTNAGNATQKAYKKVL